MSEVFVCHNPHCLWGGELIDKFNSIYSEEEIKMISSNICPECSGSLSKVNKAVRNYCYIYYRSGNNLMIRSIYPGMPRSEIHIEAADAVELMEFIRDNIEEDWRNR